jgi:crotonobetaine/carnitine-CoA ligase
MQSMNVRSFWEEKVSRLPDKTFLVFQEREFTFKAFDRLVNRVSNSLSELGVGQGDRVGGFMPNCLEWLVLYFAVAKLGAANVFVNTQYNAELLRHAFAATDLKAVMVSTSLLPVYEKVREDFANLFPQILVNDTSQGHPAPSGMIDYQELLSGSPSDPPDVDLLPRTPLQFIFTSGTTGLPKPCVTSHRYLLSMTRRIARLLKATPEDRFLSCLPNYHGNVYIGTFSALMADAVAILESRFSASRYWQWVEQYGATVLTLHITPMNVLLKQPPKPDDTDNPARAGIFLVGEGAVPFLKRFDLSLGLSMYGSTEAGGFCTMSPFGPDATHDSRFSGKPRDDIELQIWNENDEAVPPDTVGEIVIRDKVAHTIYSGYYNMPEKTADACRNFWFHSGDMGYLDAAGALNFVGRAEESIRVKGEFIPVDKLEACVRLHPDVAECAAVGVPSDIGEEDIKLFIKLQPEAEQDPEAVCNHCREHLPRFMIPRYISYVDEFPLASSALKIQKVKLKAEGVGAAWDRLKNSENLH